ncbi:MAG TPA: hypothetical protein VH643_07585 [Gemmataceae bacterium]|jgi:hypothetical protein
MEAGFIVLIILGILAVLVIRLLAGGMDRDRVRDYVEARGGKLLETNWDPFGPGWFGEKSDRIYEVRYRDKDGNVHRSHCKTSMWTGVYFTEDTIVSYGQQPLPTASSLEEENRRLREELERLKRGETS